MDDFEQTKSCWGVAMTAIVLFGGVIAVSTALLDDGSREIAGAETPTAVVATK